MNERQLGDLLLQLDSSNLRGETDPRRYTEKILSRDQHRVWWLTAGTIALWSLATLLVLLVVVMLALLMPAKAKLRSNPDQLPPEFLEVMEKSVDEGISMTILFTACSAGATSMAILLTVLLIISSRRATLRQVNANLLEISEQLRGLRLRIAGTEPRGAVD